MHLTIWRHLCFQDAVIFSTAARCTRRRSSTVRMPLKNRVNLMPNDVASRSKSQSNSAHTVFCINVFSQFLADKLGIILLYTIWRKKKYNFFQCGVRIMQKTKASIKWDPGYQRVSTYPIICLHVRQHPHNIPPVLRNTKIGHQMHTTRLTTRYCTNCYTRDAEKNLGTNLSMSC